MSISTVAHGADIEIQTSGGNIWFGSTINTAGHVVTLNAGESGNLTLAGDVSGGGSLLVRGAAIQSFAGIAVDTLNISAATTSVLLGGPVTVSGDLAIHSGGTLTQNAAVTAGSITYDSLSTIAINGAITSVAGVSIEANATTSIAATGDIAAGERVTFGETRTGRLVTAGDISTAGGGVNVGQMMTLSGDLEISSNGAPIEFAEIVNLAGHTLTLDAGSTGDLTAHAAIVGGGKLLVRDARIQTFVEISVDALMILDATRRVVLNGDVIVTGAMSMVSGGSIVQNGLVQTGSLSYEAAGGIAIKAPITASGAIAIDADRTTTLSSGANVTGGQITFGERRTGSLITAARIVSAGGDVKLTRAIILSGDVEIQSGGGSIEFTSTVSVVGNAFTLDAGETGNLSASGDIDGGGSLLVRDGAEQSFSRITVDVLTIVNARTGVTFNGAVAVAGAISVNSSGTITQNGDVKTASVSYIAVGVILIDGAIDSLGDVRIETQTDLTIRDSGSESDLQVGSGANITLLAGRDIGLGADVIVIAIEGTVTLTADTTPGNNGGSIHMHDRSLIDAGIGRIRLTADGNITIGGVKTNNGSGTAVELSTSSGTVVDGGDHFLDVDTNGRVTVNTAVSPDPSNALGIKQTATALRNVVAAVQDRIRAAEKFVVFQVQIKTVIRITHDPLAPANRPSIAIFTSVTIAPLQIISSEIRSPFSPAQIISRPQSRLVSILRSSSGSELQIRIVTQRISIIPAGGLFTLRGVSGLAHLDFLLGE